MSNDWAEEVANASAHGGGNYIDRHGHYLLAVKEVIAKTGADKGFKGDSVIFRMQVVEAKRHPSFSNEDPHGVGDVRSVVFNFKTDTMAANKMKALILAIVGKKEKEVSAPQLVALQKSIVQPSQPICGKLLKAETYEFTIKSGARAGKTGVGITWEHVPQTPDQLAAKRAELLGGGAGGGAGGESAAGGAEGTAAPAA